MATTVRSTTKRRQSALARAVAFVGQYPLAMLLVATVVIWSFALHYGMLGISIHPALDDAAFLFGAMSLLGLLGVPGQLEKERLRRSGISLVDQMSGTDFEQRLASLFSYLGYRVSPTAVTGDYGADLVMDARDGGRTVVQAKRYEGNVGIEAVQQVVGAKSYYGAAEAIVATNSLFTPAAANLAAANGVRLVDRPELIDMLAAQMRDQPRPSGLNLLMRQVVSGMRPLAWMVFGVLWGVFWVIRGFFRLLAAVF